MDNKISKCDVEDSFNKFFSQSQKKKEWRGDGREWVKSKLCGRDASFAGISPVSHVNLRKYRFSFFIYLESGSLKVLKGFVSKVK